MQKVDEIIQQRIEGSQNLEIESEPGKGTKITFRIPFIEDIEEARRMESCDLSIYELKSQEEIQVTSKYTTTFGDKNLENALPSQGASMASTTIKEEEHKRMFHVIQDGLKNMKKMNTAEPSEFLTRKVLVVDDNPFNLMAATNLLK